jgi:hypothetical protein
MVVISPQVLEMVRLNQSLCSVFWRGNSNLYTHSTFQIIHMLYLCFEANVLIFLSLQHS